MTATIAPVAVSVPQFAEALSISRAYGYVMVQRGEVRSFRLGRRLLVPTSEIERLVAQASALGEDSLPGAGDRSSALPGEHTSEAGPPGTAVVRARPDVQIAERAAS